MKAPPLPVRVVLAFEKYVVQEEDVEERILAGFLVLLPFARSRGAEAAGFAAVNAGCGGGWLSVLRGGGNKN